MSEENANEFYMEGMKLFGEGKNEEAIATFVKCLEQKPKWTEAMHGLAMCHMNNGTLDDAIRIGQEIAEIDKNDAFAHTSLSMFYQRKGMIEEAEREGAKARMINWKQELKENPDAPPPAGAMGVIPPGGMGDVAMPGKIGQMGEIRPADDAPPS
ncbi:MAG: tetratricopeptide (TPR) repeat protein [Planctomycetota bacterium]|jgi:tetratricopeptide (TPR) repeat protein